MPMRPGKWRPPVSDDAGNSAAVPLGVSRQPIRPLEPTEPAGSTREIPTDFADDVVELRLPAASAYLSVLRTATAGLAARLDFTLDEIEDLRIAVDEACAMLLGQAVPGTGLECTFTLGRDLMTISVSVLSQTARPPASDTFAWTVLCALAGSVEALVGPGNRLTIVLQKSREPSGPV